MQSPDIALGTDAATTVVDEVLEKTLAIGAARDGALHVLIVRRIGGSDSAKLSARDCAARSTSREEHRENSS